MNFIEKASNLIAQMDSDRKYKQAEKLMQQGKENDLKKAAEIFSSIPEYKDSKDLRLNCEVMLEDLKNQKVYNQALASLQSGNIRSYKKAIQKLQTIRNWRDTKQKIDELYTVLEELENEKRIKNQKLKKWAAGGAIALCALGVGQNFIGGNGSDSSGAVTETAKSTQAANTDISKNDETSNNTAVSSNSSANKNSEAPKSSQPEINVETSENYYDPDTKTFLTGEGYFKLDTGFSYTGSFVDGNPGDNEQGVMIIPNVGTYTGYFLDGKRNGEGEFVWQDGATYTGKWKDDCMNGEGSLTLADGTVYKGLFTNNLMNDTAEITYSNDDKYSGEVVNYKKAGNGTYTWADGASYTGGWNGDQMDKDGTYYYSTDHEKYYLKGKFKDNYPDGTATYIDEYGNSFTTRWVKGKCVSVEESES